MTDEEMKEIAELQRNIELRKQELSLPTHDTNVMDIVKKEENELLNSEDFNKYSKQVAEERVKSDLSAEASRIRRKNIETAESEFENETREMRLKHLKAELDLEHKYNMQTLDEEAKHKQMLNKRKKLVEKYGYLYNNSDSNLVEAKDNNGEFYKYPQDFSFSKVVNVMRQFGRNLSKLDKPILQTLKWLLITGVAVGGYFLLKTFGLF